MERIYVWTIIEGSVELTCLCSGFLPLTFIQLIDEGTKRTVANPHKKGMDYDPEIAPILDVVLISFAYCEERRRGTSVSTQNGALTGTMVSALLNANYTGSM